MCLESSSPPRPFTLGSRISQRRLRCAAVILGRMRGGLAITGAVCLAFTARGEVVSAHAAPSSLATASIEDLMNVRVTTVSREESTVGESPAAVFVINQEMIRRSGATCIPELLRMVPGVEVARLTSNQWVVSIRGFDNTLANKLLVQVDGRTVYSPVHSGVFWDSVDYPLEDIDRIEVIRGPGGTVWGANAVNGIINIITKPSKDTQGLLLSSGGGSYERGFATFRFGGKIGDEFHYRAYGKWFERGTSFDTTGLARDDWRAGRAGLRLDWTPGTADTITLQSDWFTTISGQSAVPPAVPFDQHARGVDVLGRWTHVLGKDSNWQLQAYYDRFDQRASNGADQFTVDTVDVDFHQEFPLGTWQKVVYGFGYRLQEIFFTGAPTSFPLPVSVDRNVISGFVQDEIKIVEDRFSLTVGSKFERNDYTGFEAQPSGRLLWTPTKRQSAWLAVSRAARTPDVFEHDLQIDVGAQPIFTPNPDIKSEEVIAYELGYRAQVTDKLSFDTAAFYNHYNRLSVITPAIQGSALPFDFTNSMRGDTYGVEIAATWNPTSWWKLHGAYSYLRLDLHADPKLGLGLSATDETVEKQSPQNHFYISSSFDLPGHVEFDLMGRYVDNLPSFTSEIPGFPTTVTAAVKNYFSLDARLAWKVRENIELAVVGQNLLDSHRPEFGVTIPGPQYEVRRGVYAKVTVTW